MDTRNDDERRAEAQRALQGVRRDSHDGFTGAFAQLWRARNVASPQAEGAEDRIETWARRIGRTLGYLLAALLLVNLFTGWFF